MIKTSYYSDLTKKTYDTYDEAYDAEIAWAVETLYDLNNHIARGCINEEVLAVDGSTLSLDLHTFVPLTEDAVTAFKLVAFHGGDLIENINEFRVRTPIKWDEDMASWRLLPDLVKYAHRIYTELSDTMAEIENDINERLGEG